MVSYSVNKEDDEMGVIRKKGLLHLRRPSGESTDEVTSKQRTKKWEAANNTKFLGQRKQQVQRPWGRTKEQDGNQWS